MSLHHGLRSAVVKTEKDPYWNNVVFLLRGNGQNGTTNLTELKSGISIGIDGTAYNSTDKKKNGLGSIYVPTGTSSIYTPVGTPDFYDTFTWELWMAVTGSSRNIYFYVDDGNSSPKKTVILKSYDSFELLGQYGSNKISFSLSSGSIYDGNFHHFAITYDGTKLRMFWDGVLKSESTTSSISATTASYATIMLYNLGGYIDDFRITQGVCRYNASFTPPTKPFPTS